MIKRSLSLLLLTGVFLLMGCDEYSVVIENGSTSKIFGADIRYGDFSSGGGIIGANTAKEHAGVRAPILDYATVTWRTEDGTTYERQVKVKSRLPRGFNKGDLIFTILDGGEVELSFETWAEQDAREAERRRRNPPVFEEGELAITSDSLAGNSYTEGLGKWNHPEIEVSKTVDARGDLLAYLATQIKTKGTRYASGQRVEVEGQTVCFSDGEEGRLLVEPCPSPDSTP